LIRLILPRLLTNHCDEQKAMATRLNTKALYACFQIKRLLILLISIQLMACAAPAHKNNLFTDLDASTLVVELKAKNRYLIDGIYLEHEAFTQLVTIISKQRKLSRVLIDPDSDVNLFEMAIAVDALEQQGHQVYAKNWLGFTEKVNAAQIIEKYTSDTDSYLEQYFTNYLW
jgi:hypothetical protein